MPTNRLGVLLLALVLSLSWKACADFPFEDRDIFASGPTTLLHTSIAGEAKELWAGMSRQSTLRSPHIVAFSGKGEILRNGAWLDLTTLRYRSTGTRPGRICLQSEDGLVSLEASSRKDAAASPIFVKYTFQEPVTFRYRIAWKEPSRVRLLQSHDEAGFNEFAIQWAPSNENSAIKDLNLVVATLPAGVTESLPDNGIARKVESAKEVILCLDATGERVEANHSYVAAWQGRLDSLRDTSRESRVHLHTDNPRLDRMFSDSIDAVRSAQFANGVVLADVFFYRDSWMRDGAYSILGLAMAGNFEAADRFFDFWTPIPDFPWAGGEHEAQQAGIGMMAIWTYSQLRPEQNEFLQRHWPFVERFAKYYQGRAAKEGLLDLSEEWICCVPTKSTWPNAEVYCGLRAAAKIAQRLGRPQEAKEWNDTARSVQEKLLAVGYDTELKRFIPMAGPKGEIHKDAIYPDKFAFNGPKRDGRVDSGMLMLARLEIFGKGFGAVRVDDPRFADTEAAIARDLVDQDGMIARFGAWPNTPHYPKGEWNRWPIVQCWAAQLEWLKGRPEAGWQRLFTLFQRRSYDEQYWNNYLPESWAPDNKRNDPFLTWAHGEVLTTTLLLTLGLDLEPQGADLGLSPSLPPGVNHATVENFRFRNWRMDFELTRGPEGRVDVKVMPTREGSGGTLRVLLPGQNNLLLENGKEASFSITH